MQGLYKTKPPSCKYSITWDPDIVLKLISEWDNATISLEKLTFKLVALLALVTAQRVQTLCSFKISNIVWSDPVQIKLTDILKTTKIRNPNPMIVLPPYHNCNVCPLTCLI